MQIANNFPVIISIASSAAMLLIWWFLSEQNWDDAKRLLCQTPLTIMLFVPAWLTEKLVGTLVWPWLAIGLIAPLLEETARYVATDLLDLQRAHEGFFQGIIVGFAETLILVALLPLSSSELLFRGIFSIPFHASQGACLISGHNRLQINILIHFFFNYGIFVGNFIGMGITVTALFANLIRIIFIHRSSNLIRS